MIGKRTVSLKSNNEFLAQIAYLITVHLRSFIRLTKKCVKVVVEWPIMTNNKKRRKITLGLVNIPHTLSTSRYCT